MPDAGLPAGDPPVVYLPGVSRADLRAVEQFAAAAAAPGRAAIPRRSLVAAQRPRLDHRRLPAGGRRRPRVRGRRRRGDARRPGASAAQVGRRAGARPAQGGAPARPLLRRPPQPRRAAACCAGWTIRRATGRRSTPSPGRPSRLSRRKYGFDPEEDGPSPPPASRRPRGALGAVWHRFAEAPALYPNLPERLRAARPSNFRSLFDEARAGHRTTRRARRSCAQRCRSFATRCRTRRPPPCPAWKPSTPSAGRGWGALGRAPLAAALGRLAALAEGTAVPLAGSRSATWPANTPRGAGRPTPRCSTLSPLWTGRTTWARSRPRCWPCTALAGGRRAGAATGDLASGGPWCRTWPRAVRWPLPAPACSSAMACASIWRAAGRRADCPGACLPAPARLAPCPPSRRRRSRPSPPGRPAHRRGHPGSIPGLRPAAPGRRQGSAQSARGRRVPDSAGDDLGDPRGQAWTEFGDIDSYGHEHGWKVARHLAAELRAPGGPHRSAARRRLAAGAWSSPITAGCCCPAACPRPSCPST